MTRKIYYCHHQNLYTINDVEYGSHSNLCYFTQHTCLKGKNQSHIWLDLLLAAKHGVLTSWWWLSTGPTHIMVLFLLHFQVKRANAVQDEIGALEASGWALQYVLLAFLLGPLVTVTTFLAIFIPTHHV